MYDPWTWTIGKECGREGVCRMEWSEGGKWDNCNSIINKYIKKKENCRWNESTVYFVSGENGERRMAAWGGIMSREKGRTIFKQCFWAGKHLALQRILGNDRRQFCLSQLKGSCWHLLGRGPDFFWASVHTIAPTTKYYLVQNVNNAEFEKSWFLSIFSNIFSLHF